MAIQEVEKRETSGSIGIQRNINEAAKGMIMDIVQAQQYTKPIPSTVRELTANAVDSQSEKERAFDILSGKAKVEDFFIEREGELYKDSKWDPSYYDLTKLNRDKNHIELIFREGEGIGRSASFIIRDYGVGVGKGRLEGILSIGYSSKRSRKDALGAFGIGAKVALSTGADFYRMTTVYNGVKYVVQIFNRKLNSLIGSLNLETGEPNIPYTFSDGSVMYGEATDELNYCEIEVPALNHHKDEYVLAVKTQLLYFNNVKFFIQSLNGNRHEVDFKANVLYDSKNLVISSNSPYSKPHVIIVKGAEGVDETGVCYGYIDFKELELEDLNGDVGIKCTIRQVTVDDDGEEVLINDGVSVVPSREAVLWNEHTREYIKKQFQVAQEEASTIVEKELLEKDFLSWLEACKNIAYTANRRDSIIGRLSKIVDLSTLRPAFKGDTTAKINYDSVSVIFSGFRVENRTETTDPKTRKLVISKHQSPGWGTVSPLALYFKDEKSTRLKDLYLCKEHGGTFTTITPFTDVEIANSVKAGKDSDKIIAMLKHKRDEILRLMLKSKHYLNYEKIEVPEAFGKHIDKLESDEITEEEKDKPLTNEDRRALEDRAIAHSFAPRHSAFNKPNALTYIKYKVEPKFSEVRDYTGTMYYGFQVDEDKLQFACHIMDKFLTSTEGSRFYGPNYQFVLVSKNNKKYFEKHKHINDFFGKPELVKDENGNITGYNIMVDNAVVLWNTARKMHPLLKDLLFLRNFDIFDLEMSSLFLELEKYVEKYFTPLSSYENRFGMKDHYSKFLEFLDQVETIQLFAEDPNNTPENISEKVKEIALPDGVTGGLVVDTAMINKLNTLLEYAGPVKDLLNFIPLLTTPGKEVPFKTSMLIKEFIALKHN